MDDVFCGGWEYAYGLVGFVGDGDDVGKIFFSVFFVGVEAVVAYWEWNWVNKFVSLCVVGVACAVLCSDFFEVCACCASFDGVMVNIVFSFGNPLQTILSVFCNTTESGKL